MRLLTILLGLLLSIFSAGGGMPAGRHIQSAGEGTELLLVLQAEPMDGAAVDPDDLNAAARTIERRAKGLGVVDPVVWTSGGDQIVVELPGVNGDGADRVTQALIRTALLEIIDPQGAFLPEGTVVTTTLGGPTDGATPEAGTVYETVVSGSDLKEAYATTNQLGQVVVGFELTDEAAGRFYDYTSNHVGQPMSIVIDKHVISSPVINSAIGNEGIIAGIPEDEVGDLVEQLNSGALSVPLRVLTSMVLSSVLAPTTDRPIVASDCWTADQQLDTALQQWSEPPAMVIDLAKTYTATVETSLGDFTITFFPEDAPVTVNNFVCLARAGYYDDTVFHRIVAGFVIQGGDPTGTGTGGPGYRFADEPVTRDYELGTVAMANAGPDTNGSQFFVVTGDAGTQLPPNYTIFGQVTEGMDVVDRIGKVPTKDNGVGEQSTPIEPVTIKKVTISEA